MLTDTEKQILAIIAFAVISVSAVAAAVIFLIAKYAV